MPSASAKIAVTMKPGLRRKVRLAKRMSCSRFSEKLRGFMRLHPPVSYSGRRPKDRFVPVANHTLPRGRLRDLNRANRAWQNELTSCLICADGRNELLNFARCVISFVAPTLQLNPRTRCE